MHTLAVALLGSCAMTGAAPLERRRVVRYLVITAVLTAAVIGGARLALRLAPAAASTRRTRCSPACTCCGTSPSRPWCPSRKRPMRLRRNGPSAGRHPPPRRAARRLPARLAAVCLLQRRATTSSGSTSSWRTAWPAELNVGLEFVPLDRERWEDGSTRASATSSCRASSSRRCARPGGCSRRRIWTRRWRLSCRTSCAAIRVLGPAPPQAQPHARDAPFRTSSEDPRPAAAGRAAHVDQPTPFCRVGQLRRRRAVPAERGSAWTLMYPNTRWSCPSRAS